VGADIAADIVDPVTSFEQAVPDGGAFWGEIVANYRKITKCSQNTAKAVFREKSAEGVIMQPPGDKKWHLTKNVPVYGKLARMADPD
jgi:hypothetical protein